MNLNEQNENQHTAIPSEEQPQHPVDQQVPANLSVGTQFEHDWVEAQQNRQPIRLLDDLLRHPARLTFELSQGRMLLLLALLLIVVLGGTLFYGLFMGSFSGGSQWWIVPLKLMAGITLSAVLCLPSLYILVCLSGAQQSFAETAGLLIQALALTVALLVGFAPVAWVFSQSTQSPAFMATLHWIFWGIASFFGLRFLSIAFEAMNHRRVKVLQLWKVLFILVVLQMCTTLRPLVGPYDTPTLHSKKFFLQHWGETLSGRGVKSP
jgi:hypothetical protein